MLPHVTGDKYIVYLPPAKENLERLDASLADDIEGEITKFFDVWNPKQLYDEEITENFGELKKDRSVVRAFASWWDGGDVHVLIVVIVYKKKDEDKHWDYAGKYKSTVDGFREELDKRNDDGDVREQIENLQDNSDYRVLSE